MGTTRQRDLLDDSTDGYLVPRKAVRLKRTAT